MEKRDRGEEGKKVNEGGGTHAALVRTFLVLHPHPGSIPAASVCPSGAGNRVNLCMASFEDHGGAHGCTSTLTGHSGSFR